MLPDYTDIIERAGTPKWYDGHGVPRYHDFHPQKLGVYDRYAVFAEIECQSCSTPFDVGVGWDGYQFRGDEGHFKLNVVAKFHYGDPPRHGCIGDTMNSVPRRVIGAWRHREWREIEPGVDTWAEITEVKGLNITPTWAKP